MLLGAVQSGYNLQRSVRFRSSASAYLNRTPASAGNRKTWTWSGWVKRGSIGGNQLLFTGGYSAAPWLVFGFVSDNLYLSTTAGVSGSGELVTTAIYRDPSSWYHIVLSVDTTQATASNRIKYYVNGVQVTVFSTTNYPSQNADLQVNASVSHTIGGYTSLYFDGYLAEVNFIDGQALTPSSFGSTNATTGVWQPAPYTGSYGTNGFYLKFTDNSTAAALGTDFSGNSNTWTVNNISVTAGVTYDSMTDVPTLTSATAANYAVLNNISNLSINSTLSNANLQVVTVSSGDCSIPATIGMQGSGKYYAEFVWTASGTTAMFGIIPSTYASGTAPGYNSNSAGYRTDGLLRNSGASTSSWGATWVQNDVMAIAFDAGAGTIEFYKNNVKQGSTLTGFTTDTYFFVVGEDAGAASATWVANFGQRPFTYTPPTGFVALNTFNLAASTIVKGNTNFNAVLYTGNGGTQSVTGVGFQPNFTWLKRRNATANNLLTDSVRGAGKFLSSNLTNAEVDDSAYFTSFDSDGFSMALGASSINASGGTYVAWNWKAGGAAASNTNGTITSQVSVNATAGFSVVTYTGTGANATVGHGLGVAPRMIIVKQRNGTFTWRVYHASLANTQVLYLSATDAATTETTAWNSTTPTSSVFSVGTSSATNGSTNTYVAYCWSEIDGFSKFGSYTGNGSTDGPFVYLGFEPKFILAKRTNTTGNWNLLDGTRDPYNPVGTYLYANTADAEGANASTLDFTANGFKIRQTYGDWNVSGSTYAYAVFAENPFKNSLAR